MKAIPTEKKKNQHELGRIALFGHFTDELTLKGPFHFCSKFILVLISMLLYLILSTFYFMKLNFLNVSIDNKYIEKLSTEIC